MDTATPPPRLAGSIVETLPRATFAVLLDDGRRLRGRLRGGGHSPLAATLAPGDRVALGQPSNACGDVLILGRLDPG